MEYIGILCIWIATVIIITIIAAPVFHTALTKLLFGISVSFVTILCVYTAFQVAFPMQEGKPSRKIKR